MNKLSGYVYKIINLVNYYSYIGITINDIKIRINNHSSLIRSGCPLLVEALKEYGIENFIWTIIDTADNLEELSSKEVFWISFYESDTRGKGYNILPGGFCNEGASKARRVEIFNRDTGQFFDSIKSAGIHYNIDPAQIRLQLAGRQNQVHGLKFEYVESIKQEEVEIKKRKERLEYKQYCIIECKELNKEFIGRREVAKFFNCAINTVGSALLGNITKIPYKIEYVNKNKIRQFKRSKNERKNSEK